jgi:hypothetical protein
MSVKKFTLKSKIGNKKMQIRKCLEEALIIASKICIDEPIKDNAKIVGYIYLMMDEYDISDINKVQHWINSAKLGVGSRKLHFILSKIELLLNPEQSEG